MLISVYNPKSHSRSLIVKVRIMIDQGTTNAVIRKIMARVELQINNIIAGRSQEAYHKPDHTQPLRTIVDRCNRIIDLEVEGEKEAEILNLGLINKCSGF